MTPERGGGEVELEIVRSGDIGKGKFVVIVGGGVGLLTEKAEFFLNSTNF